MQNWEIIIFFLGIAFIASSIGFGGGSSYLAVLAFYVFPFQEMKMTSLICNLIVVTGGTIVYIQNKQLDWKKVLPMILVSIPLSFFGARIVLKEEVFLIVLGLSLILAAVFLWIKTRRYHKNENFEPLAINHVRDAGIGGAIGFLSGMVGIGGGVFLSPILNIMKWDTPKKIAATSSFFILVNSIAGLAGQLSSFPKDINYVHIGLLAATVVVGGQVGTHVGIKKLNPNTIRRITAVVVLIAGLELLQKELPWF